MAKNTSASADAVPENEPNAPAMATQITPPSSVTNGHTPPLDDEYGDGAPPADLNASIVGKGDGKGGWTPGFRAQTAPERALKWERHFTEPGQDAFETSQWELRSAGITGEDGKSVFEQTNCEIPKSWSQLATNVVVSKYFRGPLGSPQRETSVKQVIGRVADTIHQWGQKGGYFASDEDAQSFRDELAYLLVHQYGAFNSPVWFNLGVKDAKQQCSACQPYDALVSTPAGLIPIGELVEKNAVGHAVYDANGVARIVATKHNGRKTVLRLHLKAGYTLDVTADHLVWKRVSHANGRPTGKWVEAGTLQAQDMLAWHRTPVVDKSQELPGEVAEAALAGWLQSDGFVGRYETGTNRSLTIEAMTVNAAEEQWVRAALDAVFPGAHSHTRAVETQDENLSCQRIRLYGDFMEPFIQKWDLMKRGNAMTVPPLLYNAPLPVVVAYLRSLFQAEGYVRVHDNAVIALDMVSEGIVRGVQSLLGRLGIYARVRFKADARADRQGCWSLNICPRGDRELFAQEIGFIAPDKQEKVVESLQLEGHAIGDVKTMQIERIEVRGEMDVYDVQTTSGEYLSNGIRVHNCFINDVYDDMESIMELAATEARLFKGGSGAGVNLWRIRSSKEQLRGGGIASGPISFMRGWDSFAGAVKCLTPDAQVYTDQGLCTVGELIDPNLEPGFHADDSVVLATKDGPMRISQVYVSPLAPTREMELGHTGLRLRGTHQHPVLTLTPGFELQWKALSQINVGDRVAVARGQEMWPDAAPTFDFAPQTTWAKLNLTYPTQMTPELARLLGYMTSEGCMDAERFRFCNADKDVFADFLRCVEAVFGHDAGGNVSERVNPKTGVTTHTFEACWTNAVRFLQCAGLGFEKSGEKRVPRSILSSPRDLVVEFLRAYFEGDGHVSTYVYASSASRALLGDVQLLLLNMGMLPLLRRHPVNGKDYWNLCLRGEAAFRFVREVGFISERKQAASDVAGDKNTNIDTLPFLVDVLRQYASKNKYFHCSDGQTRELGFGFFNRKAGSAISYNRLRNTPALLDQLEQVNPQLAETLQWLMEREFFWDTVKSVEAATPSVTYDFTVPKTHSFVANGIVNHNSGGTCLAPHQRVYTAQGPIAVEELARREEFVALSFDPPANRYKAKRARAWLAGRKPVVRVTTDKGAFELSFDHPVKLSSGEYVQAGSLAEGMSLFACTVDTQHGHLRVGLRDGKKGKEFLHRLVAADVMNQDLDGLVVHHRDGDRLNNAPENLQVMTQAEHAALHGRDMAARGEHVFQLQTFSHAGAENGMHREGAFWQSEVADAYRATQGEILVNSGRAAAMQREAARQKTLNTAFRVLNAGWQIDTFEHYVTGRKLVIGRIASIAELREQIEAEFGSYDAFVREVARANHRVVSVETIGEMEVYDVEVQCPTPDDKSPQTGHNFLIWDGDEPTGSGVVVANTRRAAKMVILNADHPDIGEFITCKADEEKKAWALIEAGYNGGFNVPGGAYDSVAFQNANHSVRVTDEFMRAAENDTDWHLRAVTTGKVTETKKARQMLKDIAQTTWICGDPGMQFDTIINDWHTCSNSDRIYASNPCSEFMFLNSTACVTKETRVSTPEGLRKIADLYVAQQSGEQVYVTTEIAGEHDLRRLSAHRRAFVTQTGEREVFKISLADGRRIRATADHRFLTEAGWKRVDQLKVKGDRLQLRQLGNTVAFTSSEAEVKRWQMLGWLTGDGVFSKDNVALVFGPDEAETARAMEDEFNHLISEARAYAGFEQEVALSVGGERTVPTLPRGGSHVTHQANGVMQINSKSQSLVKYLEEWYGFKQGTAVFKDVPSALHEASDDLKVAYLQGLFSADGCIRHDLRGRNARAEEVMLASSSPELLRSVQLILGDLGLTSRIGWTHPVGRTNPQGQLHLYNQQGRNFMALIGFPCSPKKMDAARQITENFFDANIQRPRPATVIAIEPDGIEMVYDLTEPVTHSFIAEGIVTHNCNLASLNLLKFYDMETGDFDAKSYSKACETFLTAQEIIVSFASYPTEKIGEMSEQYRPLGLGYANLGALLMAKGLAYDSDEGRALAGALTAIMTGAGYRKSAQIARNTGPFEGYAANKEPMLRVIAKHRDAVNRIDASLVAQNVMQEARNVWDDAYMTGQKYGYRNSQATVLAPTGCLVAGSLVSTDQGLVRLERLGNPNGAQWQEADFRVYTDGGVQNATKFFINGMDATRVITTQAGYSIQGTPKHRVKVVDAHGVWQWKHFRDLEAGDLLPLAMNTLIGEAQTVTLPPLGQLHWNGEWNTRVPAQMTADLAELVGYFMGDGSLHAKGLRFCVAQGDDDVVARLAQLGHELFGLEAHLTQQKGYIEVMLSSVSLAHWWDAAGFTKATPNAGHRGKGYVPRVPDAVLHSNDANVYGAFLRGLFEADGTNTLGVPSVSTAHKTFAGEIRSLLLALGFPTSSKVDTSQWGNSDLHVLRLRNGFYNPHFLSAIGFVGARKTAGVIELKGAISGKGDRVFLPRAVWDELVPCGHPLRNAMVIALKRHGGVARGLAAQIYARSGDPRVAHVLNYFFDEVQSNQDGGAQMTYDLSVPANVTYVANGFVSHNTISFMMDCDTTGVEPDIALVKYKKLVGGGLLKIVNQTVPAALRNLGYDESEIKAIVEYIDKNDTIEGAPGLHDEHLPVFDCAFKAMNGTRSIHHMGHIKMMAATQPFISGAISKTVNMPQDCTADEIYDAYLQAWKLGVKAVAIYRDGSKRTQPLSTASDAQKAEKKEGEIRRAARRKLPDERNSITHKFSIAGQEGYFMVGLYEDGSPGEIFIKMSKEGSTISGLMDSFAVAVSMCLQYGVPLRVLVNKFSHTRFEPSGYTTNRDIPIAKSLMDYIFRWFDLKFHPNGDNGHIGKGEGAPKAIVAAPAESNGSLFGENNGNVGNAQREISQMQQDAPPCPDCGALTVRSGACYKCNECGATTGCG